MSTGSWLVRLLALAPWSLGLFAADPTPLASAVPVDATREEFTLVLVPDTQRYSRNTPAMFFSQTNWIKAHQAALNLKFVIHLGDIVDLDTDREWRVADQAMGVLDGAVPYMVIPGNHDYVYERTPTKGLTMKFAPKYNAVFSPLRFRDQPWYGGHRGVTNENNYCFFKAAGRSFLIVGLEFGPTDDVLEWADQLIAAHPDKAVIVATHCYMYDDDTRVGAGDDSSPHKLDATYNDGDQIWEKLVRRHANIFMVVSGHIKRTGTGRLASKGDHGNTVHQMLSNYQMLESGGDGWLRILKFMPAERKVEVKTYSPWLKKFNDGAGQSFDLQLDAGF